MKYLLHITIDDKLVQFFNYQIFNLLNEGSSNCNEGMKVLFTTYFTFSVR